MPIVLGGINHKSAPLALRERLVFAPDDIAVHLESLLSLELVREAVILSTCNRTEIVCDTDDVDAILPWLANEKAVAASLILPHWYLLTGSDAIEHMMKVACGLDSMILGEPQILGQMKMAFVKATNVGAIGSQLDRLFQRVFNVAKKVRTSTAIGACPVSLASTIVKLSLQRFNCLRQKSILIVGAGETARYIAKRFQVAGAGRLLVANRTFASATKLAQDVSGTAHLLQELPSVLSRVDIVVTATATPEPLITDDFLSVVNRALLIVDVGVPRNVAAHVADIMGVTLHCIDDLRQLMDDNRQGREHAASMAQDLIDTEVKHYVRWLQSLEATSTINHYRQHVERLGVLECEKALMALKNGVPAEEVIERLSRSLTNKLMHKPSVKIRKAGYDGRMDMLELAQELFGIE